VAQSLPAEEKIGKSAQKLFFATMRKKSANVKISVFSLSIPVRSIKMLCIIAV
jgi:hypothetical protein